MIALKPEHFFEKILYLVTKENKRENMHFSDNLMDVENTNINWLVFEAHVF